MKKSKRKYFEQQLSKLNTLQRRLLYKRAANLRKAAVINARKNRRHQRKDFRAKQNHEDMPRFQKNKKVDTATLDDWALKVIEEEGINSIIESSLQYQGEAAEYSECIQGTVVFVGAKGCTVQSDKDQEEYQCLLGPNLSMSQKSDIAIGDKVDFAFAKDQTPVVQAVLPRKSKLSRPDPLKHDIERVIAANIDIAVVVASIRQPMLRPSLIDRYLIAMQKGGVESVICINKIDLIEQEDRENELAVLELYRQIGIKTIECSAATGEGLDELSEALRGKLCVFVGHSGTGKTTLLNKLSPEINAETGEVHGATGLGRHTTTHSILYEVLDDIWIIDTPGIREFGLWRMDSEDLKWYFDEFDEFAEHCRYANCSHTHEPECAVKDAVDEGKISELRYESYLRILDSLMENEGY